MAHRGVGTYIAHGEENIDVTRRMDGAALVERIPHNPGNPGNPFPQDVLIGGSVADLRRSRSVFPAPAASAIDTGFEWGTVSWPRVGLVIGAALLLGWITVGK